MCNNGLTCDRCQNELNLEKLCVDHVKARSIKSCRLESDKICSQQVDTKMLTSESQVSNSLCVPGMLQAGQFSANMSSVNSLCAVNATLNTACIDNLTVGNLQHCAKWRAAVTLNTNTTYTLGTNINWNVIVDDPNSNVSLLPFSYTVPTAGYYSLSFHLDQNSLTGTAVIAGIPVGVLTLKVNGNTLRTDFVPFLSFTNEQDTALSSLELLNAGDIITMKYDVLVLDPVLGLQPYVGTVNLEGNGSLPGQSGFVIHYLSSLSCSTVTCTQCPVVTIPCSPVTTPCMPQQRCMMGSPSGSTEDCGCK